ncbi:MAG: glycosyltransferase family 4 protein [Rhodobacterales bacterium]|nr:glycosyltransferase family 4 protein [Rhodobacterales bacterium]
MDAADRVVILNDFSSAEGGAGYLATALAGGLSARGERVTYICGDAGGCDWPPGVEAVTLGGQRLLEGRSGAAAMRGLYNRAAAKQVQDWIRVHDTPRTIYHLHNWSNILSPAIFSALAPLARRCVIHAHDFFLACPNGTYLDYPRAVPCPRIPLSASCLATQCDKRSYAHKLWRSARQQVLLGQLRPHLSEAHFVMIHPAMRPWLNRAIRPRHMVAIPNPVTPFGTLAAAPEKQRRLAHIGQIQRLKGVFDLAEAGRRLSVQVDFFGSGEDLGSLSESYPEHKFHGWTDRATLGHHLQTIRAVVIGTQSPEPFCLAAFEAAATGVPLILSDAILAAPELVAKGVALPFSHGNVAALGAVLKRALNDDALIARLAQTARNDGGNLGHDMQGWIADHAALYSKIRDQDVAQEEHAAPAQNTARRIAR